MKIRKKPRNLWKSKKGGIPVISELVTIVMDILPAPIKIGLFILLFTVIASFILPAIFSLFGYSCVYETGEVELYQVPMRSSFGKLGFELEEFTKGWFSIKDYQMPDDAYPAGDKHFIRVPLECIVTQEINGTTQWGYTSLCTNCTYVTNFWSSALSSVTWGFFGNANTICLSDGYYAPITRFHPLSTKQTCSQCHPPNPYYFNITNCPSPDVCFFTIIHESHIPYILDDYIDKTYLIKLKLLGAVKRAQDSSEVVNIQCTASKRPALFFFGIEVFNKTMWIILILGTFLVQFSWAWYKVILR